MAGLAFITFMLTMFEAISVSAIIPVVTVVIGGHLPPILNSILEAIGIVSLTSQMIFIMLAVAAIFFARGLFLSGIIYTQSRLIFNLQKKLSDNLLGRYVAAKFESLTDIASSTLVRTSTTELANITHGILLPLSTLMSEFALIFGSFLVLFALQPTAALALVGVVAIFAWPIYWLNRARLSRLGLIRHDMEENRVKLAQELVSGIREIKVYGLEPQIISTVASTNREYSRVLTQCNFLQNLPRVYFETLGIASLLLVCAYLIFIDTAHSDIMMFLTISGFAAFRALPSVAKVLAQFQSIRFYRLALTSYLKLFDILHLHETLQTSMEQNHDNQRAVRVRVTAKDVAYKHQSGDQCLFSGVSLDVASGEMIGLMGNSGVGKSTLVDCLIGLRTPSSGSVTFHDSSTGELLQPRVSYVPQAPVMFDASIFRNITLNQYDNTDSPTLSGPLVEALEISGFAGIMQSRKLSLTSKIVEGGRNLSGGQRQRLALARALYRRSDILVLDEATSALDKESERNVLNRLRASRPDQLIILVTHNPDLLQLCDKAMTILAGGKIVFPRVQSN